MKFKSSQSMHTSLESIALTDIIMNLFIFFFITFTLLATFRAQKESKIAVHLPTSTQAPSRPEKQIVIAVTKENQVFLDGEPVKLEDLKSRLESLLAPNKNRVVTIRADREILLEMAVKVLDASRNAGAQQLSIVTEIVKPPKPKEK